MNLVWQPRFTFAYVSTRETTKGAQRETIYDGWSLDAYRYVSCYRTSTMASVDAQWMPVTGRHKVNIGTSLGRALKARKGIAPPKRASNLPDRDFYSFRCTSGPWIPTLLIYQAIPCLRQLQAGIN